MSKRNSLKYSYTLRIKKITVSLKLTIRVLASIFLYYLGATRLYRAMKRRKKANGITILAYHDIAKESHLGLQLPSRVFDRQMRYLREQNYNIISLEEANDILASMRDIPPDTVAITFDDGYKSIYTKVYPIVKKYDIPITVFVSVQPIEKQGSLFVDAIIYGIQSTRKTSVDLTSRNLSRLPLTTGLYKDEACRTIIRRSKDMAQKERKEFLKFIFNELDVDRSDKALKDIMLNWDEIIELSKGGVSFGAHTINHPCLAKIALKDAEWEIVRSKEILEEKIGKEVTAFAYPFGSQDDITEDVRRLVEKAGFNCACILGGGDNAGGQDQFLLNRKNITDHIKYDFLVPFTKTDFAVQMSGILPMSSSYEFVLADSSPDRINVLYIIDQLRGIAGTERHLLYLASLLNKERYNCYVCTFDGSDGSVDVPQAVKKAGVPILNLHLSRIYSPVAILKAIKLSKFIRKNKIDIVQTFHFKSDTFGTFVARLSGVRSLISSKRDMGDLKSPRQIKLSKFVNRYINNYITVCDRVGERFHEIEGIPADATCTIYNGVDFSRFDLNKNTIKSRKDVGLEDSDFVVGTTAIFRPEKAYHILFEAIEKLIPKIDNLKVLIMGYGPRHKYFVEYCSKGPLKDVVHFMGRVSDVDNYLPLLDVFCLVPNSNEGFSNAIIEAMAMERPIIATDIGGNAEAVLDNETGFIIPPNNSDELVERIMMLYEDADKRRAMGKKAGLRCREVFSLDAMIRRHESLYEELYASPDSVRQTSKLRFEP